MKNTTFCAPRTLLRFKQTLVTASSNSYLSSDAALHSTRSHDHQAALPFEEIPGPWPSIPLLGHCWQYFKYGRYKLFKLHEANLDKYHRYGPIVKEEFEWRKPVVHLFEPHDFEKVFRSQGKYPHRPPNEFVRHYRHSKPDRYPTAGLAHLLGEEWYHERQRLAPALLKLGVMRNHTGAQNEICNDFVTYLAAVREEPSDLIVDLQGAAYRLALESISLMCLDSRMGCLSPTEPTADGSSLIASTKLLFEAYQELYYGLPLWKLAPFLSRPYKKLACAEDNIYDIASKHVDKALARHRRTRQVADPTQPPECVKRKVGASSDEQASTSVLQAFLDLQIDERNIKITVLDFIAGGIFTVSNSLSYLFYHLAANPNVQEKLHAEISAVLPDRSIDVTSDHLASMPYLKACIKESFRLTSTVPNVVRVLPEATVLAGYEVPAGTTVFSHFLVACKLDQNFDAPKEFRPERWLGKSRQSVHPFALLPFGFGSRMCVGRRFAELELYLSVVKVLLNYRLEAVTTSLDLTHAFIVIPAHSIQIKIRSRP